MGSECCESLHIETLLGSMRRRTPRGRVLLVAAAEHDGAQFRVHLCRVRPRRFLRLVPVARWPGIRTAVTTGRACCPETLTSGSSGALPETPPRRRQQEEKKPVAKMPRHRRSVWS